MFFSFHFQNDINRVNIVRKSWKFRPGNSTRPVEWFDNSIWEEAKRTSPRALKRLINGGLEGTSVTCVLAGTDTWARPWVRYEIVQSVTKGNGLLTVFIDGVRCMNDGYCARGPNPLDYIGLELKPDGKAAAWENFGGKWRPYAVFRPPIRWPTWLAKPSMGWIMPLSAGAAVHDYGREDGFNNLSTWAQTAAIRAGR